jgi:hypothetical protein
MHTGATETVANGPSHLRSELSVVSMGALALGSIGAVYATLGAIRQLSSGRNCTTRTGK